MRNTLVTFLLFVIGVWLVPEQTFASHAMGTDITYECLGSNQYQVTVSFYRDCAGIAAPSTITLEYFSPSCGTSTGSITLNQQSSAEVSPLCPSQLQNSTCNGGPFPGVEQYVYSGIVTLPTTCPDWIIQYSECCRNDAITNLQSASSYDLFAFATINNTNSFCNNSPVFTTLPVPYVCAGVPFNYNHGAVDIDGDSLVYSLVQPSSDYQVPINYQFPFTVNYPMSTASGSFGFDTTTGQMTFTPDIQQVAVLTVMIEEYRNGVLIGTTMRDIQIVVLATNLCTNQPPNISHAVNISGGGLIDSNSIQMCPNNTVSFSVYSGDANNNNVSLTSNASSAIPGSVFSVTGTGSNRTGTFTWTPTLADTGFHAFQITYVDDGCPVSTPQTVTFTINVFKRVSAGIDQVYCGDPVQLHAVGGSYFNWSPPNGLSCSACSDPVATPIIPRVYTVTSDCGEDSVFVDVQPPYVLNAGNDTSICLNSKVEMQPLADPAFGPYTYSWSPGSGLSNSNIANPEASPTVSTTYILTSTSAQGCIKKDTLKITISGVAPSVTAYADPDTVCPGESTQLSLTTAPVSCGLNTVPCNTSAQLYTAGTGSSQTGDGTPYEGFWHDARAFYLYKASELQALGIAGGTFTQIAFRIGLKESTMPYNNFTIKMACTNLNSLSGFPSTAMSTVYGPTSYTSTSGWNIHTLSNPYDWDGVSNLLVEVCFDNSTYTQDDDIYYTTTPFSSVAYDYTDGSSGCSLSSPVTGSNRPNTRFSVCQQSVTGAIISWSPSNHMNNPSLANPIAQVFGTTKFNVNVDQGGCVGNDFVTVTVDTSVYLIAGPDTSLCVPNPIQLHSTAIGTPSPILLTCGTHNTPTSATTIYSIGTSTSVTSSSTPYKGDWQDGKMQVLFRKPELIAAGITRGVFTAIAFNISAKNSTMAFNNFTISMGCTGLDTLSSTFETGLDVVFTPKPVNTTTGWNTYTLDNTFDWDGSSNLIVQVCFDNNGYVGNDVINFTATSYTSVNIAANDFVPGGGCALNNPTGNTSRPNMRFTVSPPPPGAFTYTWTPGNSLLPDSLTQNPIANPFTTTNYVVSVTDGICVAYDTVTISFYTDYDVNVFGTNIGCNGASDGNAVSVPNGGVAPYNFVWNTSQVTNTALTDTVYNLFAGTYSVTVTDNNGCLASDSVTITVPPPLTLDLTSRDVSCYNGANGYASASGGGGTTPYHYQWSHGDTNATALSLNAGVYRVTLTDKSGCTIADTTELFEPTELLLSLSTVDVSCYNHVDGSATASVTGGSPPYYYLWSDSQTTPAADSLKEGFYAVTVTDDSNCIKSSTFSIIQPDSFGIVISATDVSCFNSSDGKAFASVLGDTVNYTFDWNSSPPQTGPIASGLPSGMVQVMVTDTTNCSITSTANIGFPDEIILSTISNDVSCFKGMDGSAQVTVTAGGVPPFTYLWDDNQTSTSATGLSAGDYYVTVTDSNLCEKYDTVAVAEPTAISVSEAVISVSCFDGADGSISLTYSGGTPSYSFQWSNGQTTDVATGLASDTFSVTVTDQNNCQDSIVGIVIAQPSTITFDNVETFSSCPGSETGVIVIDASGGTPPYMYSLDGGLPQSAHEFNSLAAGNYNLQIIDGNNCAGDSVVTITPFDSIVVAFDPEVIKITLGEESVLEPVIVPFDTASQSFSWTSTSGVSGLSCNDCPFPVASPDLTTVYLLTVTDQNGCSDTATVTVEVANDLILEVPNAFSPNGDGINDILLVYGIAIESVDFKIFNRWGEKVFETTNKDDGWDGTYKGKLMPPDVYIYYAEAVYEDGQAKAIKGSVTIVK